MKFRHRRGDELAHAIEGRVLLAGITFGEITDVGPALQDAVPQQIARQPPDALPMIRGLLLVRHKPKKIKEKAAIREITAKGMKTLK